MIRQRFLVRASIGAMVAVGPMTASIAHAGQANNSRDYGRPADTPENRADFALRLAAGCVYRTVPTSARKILATAIGSDDERKRTKALPGVARPCFQPQWPEFPATALRVAIAETAYREQYFRNDPGAPPTGEPPASFGVVPAGTTGTDLQQATWSLAAIGRCVVFADPQHARDLVLGPRHVDEETRRFALLAPAIARCTGDRTAGMLTAGNLRGFIADALLVRAEVKR